MNVLKIFLGVLIVLFCVNCEQNIRENPIQISLVNLGKVETSRIEFVQNTLQNKFKIDTIINFNQELPTETYYPP